mgnify:CR=1 FL=1
MRRSVVPFGGILLAVGCACAAQANGPWNLSALRQVPAAQWGARTGLVQEVYYTGEPLGGKPTRVFGWLGRPADGQGPLPAMLLVHGGATLPRQGDFSFRAKQLRAVEEKRVIGR